MKTLTAILVSLALFLGYVAGVHAEVKIINEGVPLAIDLCGKSLLAVISSGDGTMVVVSGDDLISINGIPVITMAVTSPFCLLLTPEVVPEDPPEDVDKGA